MNMSRRCKWRLFSVVPFVLLFLTVAIPTRADLQGAPAVNLTNITYKGTIGDYCMGWQFDVLQPVNVTALGVADWPGHFPNGSAVGIWNNDGTLLASTIVMPTDPKDGTTVFRFKELSYPVRLEIGNDYVIGAVIANGMWYSNAPSEPTGWSVNPLINYDLQRPRYISGNTLQYPMYSSTKPNGKYGYFGPNFLLEPVPEPALLQLPFLLGMGGVGFWWRRRRSQ